MDEAGSNESATVEALAEDAPGDIVTPEILRTPLVKQETTTPERGTETATLASLLDSGEKPLYLLTGSMLDRVLDNGSRRRRVAAQNCAVLTFVTDRAVHFVVQYADRFDRVHLPLERVRGVAVDTMGQERRVRIQTDEDDFAVYPDQRSAADIDAVVSYLTTLGASDDEREVSESDDGVSALERLATLHEQGHLTDEEFARAKREYL